MTPQDDTDTIQIVPDPDKLDRYHRQQLSAMLDGELSPDQARFMLRRLQHDVELAQCWERWQVGGDVLRGQRNALLPADFAQKVSAAIAGDAEVPEVRSRAGGPRLLRWGGGAALAASVAMAALLVGRQAGIEPEQAPPQALPELAASGNTAPASPDPVSTPDAPAPTPSPVADTAVLLAGTALAAAEAPRRATGRGGDQARRTAATRPAEASRGDAAQAPQPTAVAATGPDTGTTSGRDAAAGSQPGPQEDAATLFADLPAARQGIGADPFEALPMTVASRPWPRATSGVTGGYSVGFGSAMPAAPAWPGTSVPQGSGMVEMFGLPAATVPEPAAATAIGPRALGTGDAPPTPAALLPGPR